MIYLTKYVFQIKAFQHITGINQSKILTKHISCKCKCRFDGKKCNSNQWWINGKCWCECKKTHVCEINNVDKPATCNCENGKYLASIMDKIICDEIIENLKETNFNEKNLSCKAQSVYILHIDSC